MWYLEELNTKERLRHGPITNNFLIGRSLQSNIKITHRVISRRHCILNSINDIITIRDLSSGNGVYVNGTEIEPENDISLKENDEIRIGVPIPAEENSTETFYVVFKLIRVLDNNCEIDCDGTTKDSTSSNEFLHKMSPILSQSSRKRALCIDNDEIHIPAKIPTLINNSNNDINYEEISNSKASSNEVEIDVNNKNTDVLIIEDSDDEDLFKEKNSNNSATPQHYYNLTLEEDNNDKEEEKHILEHLSQIKQETPEIEDDIFYISSEDEDNPWLDKLSQSSSRSPPRVIKEEDEDEDDKQWWPTLSQNFMDEIEAENIFTVSNLSKTKDNSIDNRKEIDEANKSTTELSNSKLGKPSINSIRDVQVQLNRLEEIKLQIKIPHVNKPEIIEAPIMASKSKNKHDRKKSTKGHKTVTNEQLPLKKTDKINKESSKSREFETKTHKKHVEKRKERLKEIANEHIEKKKMEQLKNCKPDEDKQKKEITKPKVKLTRTNRNDLFVADITKEQPQPSTSKSKTDLKGYKIPKTKSKSSSKSSENTEVKNDSRNSDNRESLNKHKKYTREKDRKHSNNSSCENVEEHDNTKKHTATTNETKNVEKDKNIKSSKEQISESVKDKKHNKYSEKEKKSSNKNENQKKNLEKKVETSTVNENKLQTNSITNKMHDNSASCSSNIIKIKSALKNLANKSKIIKKVQFNLEPQIKIFEVDEKEIQTVKLINEQQLRTIIELPNIRQIKRTLATAHSPPCEDIIWEITSWEAEWLIKLKNTSPVVIMNQICSTSLIYQDYQMYCNTILPLMLLELWYYIKREYDYNSKLTKVFTGDIRNVIHTSDNLSQGRKLTKIECVLLLAQNDDMIENHPTKGDVILIKIPIENSNKERKWIQRFGYVLNIVKQPVNSGRDIFTFELLASVQEPIVALYLTIATKYDENISTANENLFLRCIARIVTQMRQLIALQQLPYSPLSQLILNPLDSANSRVDYRFENLVSQHKLNPSQMEAVQETCASCLAPVPKICLIQGPPGTGKSYVIVNIVLQLLYGNNRFRNNYKNRNVLPKILLCAPSNAAIDNLTLHLLHFRQRIPERDFRFRMVRVGQLKSMHPDVRLISLQSLSEKNQKEQFFENAAERNAYNHKMEYVKKDIKRNQYQSSNNDIFIEKADVVCTTLGSCYSGPLERLSKDPKFRFTCCIIDEASQCNESDTLIPLMLDIDTLVLVGDPNQLPATVLSQDAKKYGHGISLFERFQNCFNQYINNDTHSKHITFLNTQYRMHPEILLFPNAYFYDNKILNGSNVLSYQFPLIKYQLFLHEFQQSSNEDNISEAKLISNMLIAISKILKNVRIGVITPYQQQKFRITKCLNEHSNSSNDIEIATVDSFQGREKDIIILSCVRTDGLGFLTDRQRLNVALTRAKHALYIVGNFQSLETNLMWHTLKMDAVRRKCTFFVKNTELSIDVFCKVLEDPQFTKHSS